MSSSNRGRGIGGRGGDKPLPVPPGQDRDRGRRGQPPVHHEAVVQTGLLGQRQGGDASGRGNRILPTRGGSSSATRQGTGNPAPGGSRAAAAAHEATRRQRAADEKARIRAGRQNPQTQKKVGEASSSHGRDGHTPAGPSTEARDILQPKDAARAIPPNANNVDYDDDDDDDAGPAAPTSTSLPVDLPTTYYEALRHVDTPSSTYINYPARIHHLKSPTTTKGGGAFNATPSVGHKWEDIHLHQKVSSSRLHTRWTRPATPGEVERSREFFIRFHAAGCEEPFMGFRPYKDILFLDSQFIKAALLEERTNNANMTPESLVSFLTAADRIKVRILAIAASAFHFPPNRARVCAALLSAFPALMHVFLVSAAPVPRPVSAAWDLDTEFARWVKVSNDARGVLKAQRTEDVVASVGAYGEGDQHRDELTGGENEGGRTPLVVEVEGAFVLARESGLRTAEDRAQAEKALEKKRETVDRDSIDLSKVLAPGIPTSDVSSGSNRSSGVARKIKVEPYVMLYFKDAYDRAVSKGWSEEADRTSVDHLDLEME